MVGKIEELVEIALQAKASDIHLVVGYGPKFRINGALRELNADSLTPDDCVDYAKQIIGVPACERVQAGGEIDTARTICGTRCRINVYRQQGVVSIALRLLANQIPAMETLGLPKVINRFIDMRHGMVLVTGETGSGKSTTLASVIDRICQARPVHIITLEDPIEYIYSGERALVNQREVGLDTASFSDGIRAILREDPDVILIGEMRDVDTISNAIRAAETGHLVFEAEKGQPVAGVLAEGLQQFARRCAGHTEHICTLTVEIKAQHHGISENAHLGVEPELPPHQVGESEVAVAAPTAQAHSLVGFAVGDGQRMKV